ncbi:MAG TPA: FkbM family methyltransferase [Stellaceae bacterium]|nr:FkbM family methyltransferase [Stellaceae bacterium]
MLKNAARGRSDLKRKFADRTFSPGAESDIRPERFSIEEADMQFGQHQLKRCRYGWMLFSGPFVGKCFELYGEYSESEVSLMRSFVGPGDTAIDIGAYIGDLTVPMSRFVGDTGRIYAIESHIEHYHLLCANLALNGIRNVKALNYFVANSDTVDTAGPWGEFGGVSEVWGTTVVSLDSLALPACSFIKVDVDGKELEVLRSGERCLDLHRPVVYFENDVREASPALLQYLLDREYDIYWHPAPIFDEKNFFGNPINHWHPKNIVSQMMLGVPKEKDQSDLALKKVSSQDEWWDF